MGSIRGKEKCYYFLIGPKASCRGDEENLSLQHQLKAARITIEELKKNRNDYDNEIARLQSKLLLNEAYVGKADTQLHVKHKAYLTGFKECKSLAIQILPSVEACLLQIPITARAISSFQEGRASWGRGHGV